MRDTPQHIIRVAIRNFMRLECAVFTLDPKDNLVTIGGPNGAGKSSMGTAIRSAILGKRHAPSVPVRRGASSAEVILETEDLIIKEEWSAEGGSRFKVQGKNGRRIDNKRSAIAALAGTDLDPLAFWRQPGKTLPEARRARAETLRDLAGLDFTDQDEERARLFAERTASNAEVKRLDGALKTAATPPPDTPDDEVSVSDLTDDLKRRSEVNAANDIRRRALENKRTEARGAKADADRIDRELADARRSVVALERELEAAKKWLAGINDDGKTLGAKVAALVDEDVAEVGEQIATLEKTNRAIRMKQARVRLALERSTALALSEKLSRDMTAIDEAKALARAAVRYPVESLTVENDDVYLDGVPFEQASQAEQIRTSVALALAENPEISVLWIQEASLLDSHSLRILADAAAAAGAQLFLETVAEDSEGCTVWIVDGKVAGGTAEVST